ncbi:zinc ribbon domain-containing protein [Propionibacterium freudenreichii]|uniref:zinc-ribbon domain-containing protein n=1 Tax=Propionibacterium freudenreichii TaxID=1744 RepID=UPI0009BF276A
MQLYCGNCGAPLPTGATVCQQCGTPVAPLTALHERGCSAGLNPPASSSDRAM